MSFWLHTKCIRNIPRHRYPLRAHQEFEYDAMCGGIHDLTEMLEGLCRAFVFVSLVELMWDSAIAACKWRLCRFLQETFVRGTSRTAVAISFAAVGLTVCVAESNDFSKFDPSSWVAWYCRVADSLCHTFVLSGLVGLAFELFSNACRSNGFLRCKFIFLSIVFCDDDMERHGVQGILDVDVAHLEADRPFQGAAEYACPSIPRRKFSVTDLDHPACSDYVRAAWLWLVFCSALASYFLDVAELLPQPLSLVLDQINVACWAAITYILTDFIHGVILHENPLHHFHAVRCRHQGLCLLTRRRSDGAHELPDACSSSSEE